jgi:hypothetical protein
MTLSYLYELFSNSFYSKLDSQNIFNYKTSLIGKDQIIDLKQLTNIISDNIILDNMNQMYFYKHKFDNDSNNDYINLNSYNNVIYDEQYTYMYKGDIQLKIKMISNCLIIEKNNISVEKIGWDEKINLKIIDNMIDKLYEINVDKSDTNLKIIQYT